MSLSTRWPMETRKEACTKGGAALVTVFVCAWWWCLNLPTQAAANAFSRETMTATTEYDAIMWFSAVRTHKCSMDYFHEYYKVALKSAVDVAGPLLIPVLIVWGTLPAADEAWVVANGGHIVYHDLSFHADLHETIADECSTGAFLRLDIATAVLPGLNFSRFQPRKVWRRHFLYTDNDVFFARRLDWSDVVPQLPVPALRQSLSFSEEHRLDLVPANTGVMFVDAEKFAKEWLRPGGMRDFAFTRGYRFDAWDQGLVLAYQQAHNFPIKYLDRVWNFKMYWSRDVLRDNIAVVHLHGPGKRNLECYVKHLQTWKKVCGAEGAYRLLLEHADQNNGATAIWVFNLIEQFKL